MRKFCANFCPPRGGRQLLPQQGSGGGGAEERISPAPGFPQPSAASASPAVCPPFLSVLFPPSVLRLPSSPATPSPWRSSPSAHPDVPEGPSKPTLQTPDGVTPTPASSALGKPCFLVKKKN